MQFLKAKSVVGQALQIRYLVGNFSLLAKFLYSATAAPVESVFSCSVLFMRPRRLGDKNYNYKYNKHLI